MTGIPIVVGRGHEGHAPAFEVQGGERLAALDQPWRIDAVLGELERRGGFSVSEINDHGLEPILAVHDRELLDFLASASTTAGASSEKLIFADAFQHAKMRAYNPPPELGPTGLLGAYCYDTITAFEPGTHAAAIEAANCALSGCDLIEGGSAFCLALTRPPGHHASASLCGGGTFLNNAAIATQALLDAGRSRVALLDVDIHHGNGSQAIFYERGEVFFASLHIDPRVDYPLFSGFAAEQGAGAGKGANLNLPLARGTTIEEYSRSLETALEAIGNFGADALVVSLGVDGHNRDPVEAAALKTEDFRRIGAATGELDLPTLALLEGGYAIDVLGPSIAAWLEGFSG